MKNLNKTKFGRRIFGRSTLWETYTSVLNDDDKARVFIFLPKWEAYKLKVNFFLV